jgi:hypothetical protein
LARIARKISAVVQDFPVPVSEQLVDAHHGGDGAVLADAADAHRAARIAAEGRLELAPGGDAHAVAERGIDSDAAGEQVRAAALVPPQLADEAELGGPDLRVAVALGRDRHAQRRDDGEHDGVGGVNAQ